MRASWIASVRRIWSGIGSPFALPAMGTADEGTWYELRPDGIPLVAVANPERYGDRAQAEEAASRLRMRHSDFRFVEIISYEIRNGRRSEATLVERV
ncbi:MAG: hypothetical protein M3Q31_16835 [Actinomycetota bacterium]|nr:hypothetical protein [Actinomycetota bacterium]